MEFASDFLRLIMHLESRLSGSIAETYAAGKADAGCLCREGLQQSAAEMTDDGDLPISFYRERHASKKRAGNFLAVTTLDTVLLLPPLQDFVSPGALRGAPLTFGVLGRLLCCSI